MSFVVTNVGTGQGFATVVITVGSPIAAGTDVIVCVTAANISPTVTVADSKGNTYSSVVSEGINGNTANGIGIVLRSNLATGLAINDTITVSCTPNSGRNVVSICSVTGGSGIDTAVIGKNFGSSSTPTVTSGTPSQSGDLFIGVVCQTNTRTLVQPSGGWAAPPNAEVFTNGVAGGNLVNSGATALTYNPTYSGGSAFWAALIFGINPATLSSTPKLPLLGVGMLAFLSPLAWIIRRREKFRVHGADC